MRSSETSGNSRRLSITSKKTGILENGKLVSILSPILAREKKMMMMIIIIIIIIIIKVLLLTQVY
jgi:hypothetical protein